MGRRAQSRSAPSDFSTNHAAPSTRPMPLSTGNGATQSNEPPANWPFSTGKDHRPHPGPLNEGGDRRAGEESSFPKPARAVTRAELERDAAEDQAERQQQNRDGELSSSAFWPQTHAQVPANFVAGATCANTADRSGLADASRLTYRFSNRNSVSVTCCLQVAPPKG